jgi:RNA polymerase sigma factor (TIGR02999 family)
MGRRADPPVSGQPDRTAGSVARNAVPLAGARQVDGDYVLLYDELRRLARSHLGSARSGHTLGPTALVHESYLKLAGVGGGGRSRAQFLALASRAMRHVLVDHARSRGAEKRGGGAVAVTLRPEFALAEQDPVDLIDLHRALATLGEFSERMERIVECRVFGGLTTAETAEALGTSVRTVEREWTRARAYLHRLLEGHGG